MQFLKYFFAVFIALSVVIALLVGMGYFFIWLSTLGTLGLVITILLLIAIASAVIAAGAVKESSKWEI